MKSSQRRLPKIKKRYVKSITRIIFWFSVGAVFTLFLISSFSYLAFQNYYKGEIYPGVRINGVDFGNKTEKEVRNYYVQKNNQIEDLLFLL